MHAPRGLLSFVSAFPQTARDLGELGRALCVAAFLAAAAGWEPARQVAQGGESPPPNPAPPAAASAAVPPAFILPPVPAAATRARRPQDPAGSPVADSACIGQVTMEAAVFHIRGEREKSLGIPVAEMIRGTADPARGWTHECSLETARGHLRWLRRLHSVSSEPKIVTLFGQEARIQIQSAGHHLAITVLPIADVVENMVRLRIDRSEEQGDRLHGLRAMLSLKTDRAFFVAMPEGDEDTLLAAFTFDAPSQAAEAPSRIDVPHDPREPKERRALDLPPAAAPQSAAPPGAQADSPPLLPEFIDSAAETRLSREPSDADPLPAARALLSKAPHGKLTLGIGYGAPGQIQVPGFPWFNRVHFKFERTAPPCDEPDAGSVAPACPQAQSDKDAFLETLRAAAADPLLMFDRPGAPHAVPEGPRSFLIQAQSAESLRDPHPVLVLPAPLHESFRAARIVQAIPPVLVPEPATLESVAPRELPPARAAHPIPPGVEIAAEAGDETARRLDRAARHLIEAGLLAEAEAVLECKARHEQFQRRLTQKRALLQQLQSEVLELEAALETPVRTSRLPH